jgi:hypothetical protein
MLCYVMLCYVKVHEVKVGNSFLKLDLIFCIPRVVYVSDHGSIFSLLSM